MKLVLWGTYDKGKPRVRILLRGLRENGIEVIECHANIWQGVEDKFTLKNSWKFVSILWIWLTSYPKLIFKYLYLPKHDAVLVGYMGHLDTIIIWPFAKLRGVPLVWDAFLSIFNTIVEDRKLIGGLNPLAYFIYITEWLSCHVSDLILLDTNAHIKYFCKLYNLSPQKFFRIFVGVENEKFSPNKNFDFTYHSPKTLKILFYGQFIPLHGIEHIISCAQILEKQNIEFTLIGDGQEKEKIKKMLMIHPLAKLNWISWVPYESLSKWICEADICLGIFGISEKASLVIPNKVFQVLACGKPLITRESPAIREIISPEMPGICLIPPADPNRMAEAILKMSKTLKSYSLSPLHQNLLKTLTPKAIGKSLESVINLFIKNNRKGIFNAN